MKLRFMSITQTQISIVGVSTMCLVSFSASATHAVHQVFDTGYERLFLCSCRAALSVCINMRIVPYTVTWGPGSCSVSALFAVVSVGQLLGY